MLSLKSALSLRIEIRRAAEGRMSVRAPSKPRSVLRAAAWVYFGPFVAVGAFALAALGFGALSVVVQLLAALLKRAGV